MADLKISELTNLTAADPVSDMLPIVDVSATPPASGSTKRISINNILSSSPTASGAFSVTGLVTAGSAAITGAATVGTTLGVTGNLTASSNVYVPASTTFKVGPVAGTWAGLRFDSAKAMILDSDTTITFRVNGGTSFSTAGSIDTSGNLNLNTGNVVMTTSGKGIDFSATANSSGTMTSELLNDYEEGTWTGTLTGSTTNPTVAVTATGRYTKIGRQVSVQIAFESVSTIGASGNLSITGLPFANAALRAIGTAGAFTGATFTGTLISQIESSASSILFYGVVSNSAWASATHNPNATTFFWANLTYTV
jgi:hypothetical protein